MDEKTERLREVFMDVTESETVTESQEEPRGSLADADESEVMDRIEDVIDRMRERYGFTTSLSNSALAHIVQGVYRGADDEDLADDLDVDPAVVFRARMDLHLVRETDAEAPFDLDRLRASIDEGKSPGEIAEELDTDRETVDRYRRVVTARAESRQVSQRFRSEFEEILADAGLATNLTASVKEDGLAEATEDAETDVPR